MRYLLDTNTCIYSINHRPAAVARQLASRKAGDVAISCVTAFELWYGVRKSGSAARNDATLRNFLSPFVLLPFEPPDAERCGDLRAILETAGKTIGPFDLQIASQALSRGLILVTHNTREFSRIPDLKLEDWVQTGS